MEYPQPTPTSERLPARAASGFAPFSDDVLAFAPRGGWQRGSYQYAGETGRDGSWEFDGKVVNAAEVTHWMPMPPDPK
jgi:hypothetical protein